MINPDDVRKKAEMKYPDFLSSLISGESFFPLNIPFGKIKPSETLTDFSRIKKEIEILRRASTEFKKDGYSLELKERRDRKIGLQSFPCRIYFNDLIQYTAFLDKEKETEDFSRDAEKIIQTFPLLKDWIIANPLVVVENHTKWDDILKVCLYFKVNPKPDLYIRELPLEVDTKFIENNKAVFTKIFNIILEGRINEESKHFESRFGLRYNEPLIRFRMIDDELCRKEFNGLEDISIPLSSFNQINPQCQKVFIMENIFNFLAFPKVPNSIAIFGSGFRLGLLKNAQWLKNKKIYYWGDIDTHGFQILNQIRGYFPQVVSFLMDRKTFNAFPEYQVDGAETSIERLDHLTEKESQFYAYLFSLNRFNRLEQEKIPLSYLVKEMKILDVF